MEKFYRSVLEQDRAAVVICDLEHVIIYMNKMAKERYGKSGGAKLIGQSLFSCHSEKTNEIIKRVVAWFLEDEKNNMIYTFRNEEENKDVYMVALRDENNKLIGYYEKHEYRNVETAKRYDFSKSLI